MSEISTLISNLGFPIVACCAMFYMLSKYQTSTDVTLKSIEKTIQELVVIMRTLTGEDEHND